MIDSTLFAVDVPAGTYAAGDKLPLVPIRGPAVVRDGYGSAILKQVVAIGADGAVVGGSYVEFKNANWNDSLKTMISSANGNQQFSILAKTSPAIQRCGNIELQPNSSFEINLVIGGAVTTTAPCSIFLLMDIDYPSVAAISNPKDENGLPTSIIRGDAITVTGNGSAASTVWTTLNVDEFKAGYRYLLAQVGAYVDANTPLGFVEFSGAPSMNGLIRIIPVIAKTAAAGRMELEYSTPLVKGPMNIGYAFYGTAGANTVVLECDYIRR